MSLPQKHDYKISSSSSSITATISDNKIFKKDDLTTELRLGLPGSQKILVSGSKRGFSDTIDTGSGDGKWLFSETDLMKNGGCLFSPKSGGNGGKPFGLSIPAKQETIRVSPADVQQKQPQISAANGPASNTQVVGWPPIRSFRKNTMANNSPKNENDTEGKPASVCIYVKVGMDGAPYLRKVDLRTYCSYQDLSSALEKMFSCFTIGECRSQGPDGQDRLSTSRLMDLLKGSEYVLTYEDKDGDWMLVGDVPWDMFLETCARLRIMKSSDAIGLAAPGSNEKCKA